MDQELESLNAFGLRFIVGPQDLLKHLDTIHYTVVVVLFCLRMLFIGTITISHLREAGGIRRDIHKMPAEGFRPLGADFVGQDMVTFRAPGERRRANSE